MRSPIPSAQSEAAPIGQPGPPPDLILVDPSRRALSLHAEPDGAVTVRFSFWSHRVAEEDVRRLFRWLAVFVR